MKCWRAPDRYAHGHCQRAAIAALNIDPAAAAAAYREKLVGPYRGKLPEAVVRGMEEQAFRRLHDGDCRVRRIFKTAWPAGSHRHL